MRKIRSKGMNPEILVRKMIYRMGYRYRLHRSDLLGRPDLVFTSRKKVIFVHGCFWHQHAATTCKIARVPKSNKSYWLPKLQNNVERDAQHLQCLKQAGWDVLVIWECEIRDRTLTENRVRSFLDPNQQGT